jgi:hypothetical protein
MLLLGYVSYGPLFLIEVYRIILTIFINYPALCAVLVLQIHDILALIRIRICGSAPLTNESVSVSGSCCFRH